MPRAAGSSPNSGTSGGSRIRRSSPAACCRWRRRPSRRKGRAALPPVRSPFRCRGLWSSTRSPASSSSSPGFDGVEIHGANGYLVDEFLRDGTNHRTDVYGGPVENRARFLLEVTEAVAKVWGADRVGVRLSPLGSFNSMSDSNPEATFGYAAAALDRLGLAYLHVAMLFAALDPSSPDHSMTRVLREKFHGPLIINGGYGRETGNAVLAAGLADLVSFGVIYLANPDLAERFAEGAPLNTPDRDTFYGGDAHGYIDYPTRDAVPASV
jgi:N-ethylmaleimide reductase